MWGIVDTMGLLMGIGRLAAPALGTGSADDEEEEEEEARKDCFLASDWLKIPYSIRTREKKRVIIGLLSGCHVVQIKQS